MKSLRILPLLAACLITSALIPLSPAHAEMAGHPVILVNGFQKADLQHCPTEAQVKAEGKQYWSAFWNAHAEKRINWSSCNRVETSVAQEVWPKLERISESGLCAQGCIFVTHSSGALVLRYLLANQAHWLQSVGLPPLKTIAVLDFGGADGGTSLASIAVEVASNNAWYLKPLKAAVKAWLGYDLYGAKNLGVLNDLVPSMARTIAMAPTNIPHLRFVGGNEWQYYGVTIPFLSGRNDSVVALQSQCGAAKFGSYDSCVPYETMEGKQTSTNAPAALWYNYYPVLMGAGTNHSGLIGTQKNNAQVPAFNGFNANGLWVGFPAVRQGSYVQVPNSASLTMSQLVYRYLN